MATIFSHAVVPAAIAAAFGRKVIPKPLLIAGVICSMFPDADCAAFAFGIPYESQFGHRGFTHSIVFAVLLAALWAWRNMEFNTEEVKPPRWVVFVYLFVCTVSHGLLDGLTDGGLGVAFFWPFEAKRHFLPGNLIPVSPIGGSFFSARGFAVLWAELSIIWLPGIVIGLGGFGLRMLRKRTGKAP